MLSDKFKEKVSEINFFVSDVDGVLTDAGMYYSEDGYELKKFNTRDGGGFLLLRLAGIDCALITQENTEIVKRRAEKLGLPLIQGAKNKIKSLSDLIRGKYEINEVAYIGDDINDIKIMNEVGFSIAVADACDEIKDIAHYITSKKGGDGAVREAAHLILRQKDLYRKALNKYLENLDR